MCVMEHLKQLLNPACCWRNVMYRLHWEYSLRNLTASGCVPSAILQSHEDYLLWVIPDKRGLPLRKLVSYRFCRIKLWSSFIVKAWLEEIGSSILFGYYINVCLRQFVMHIGRKLLTMHTYTRSVLSWLQAGMQSISVNYRYFDTRVDMLNTSITTHLLWK